MLGCDFDVLQHSLADGHTWHHIDYDILRRALWLAIEEVGDGRDSVELERLIGVELEFHVRR